MGLMDREEPPEQDVALLREELQQTRAALADARRDAAEARARAQAAERMGQALSEFAAAAPGALWVADATNGEGLYVSPGVGSLLRVPPEEILPEAGRWLGLVHPDDRPAVSARFASLCHGEAAEIAYRVLPVSKAVGSTGDRAAAKWVNDIGFPITDRRGRVRRVAGFAHAADGSSGEEGLRRLLLAELNHRVRNALASVQSVAAQTVRATADPKGFWDAFAGRLRAMARTHDMLADRGWPEGVDLHAMVAGELAPYLHAAGPTGPRAEIDGPAIRLPPTVGMALALALHELTTNAVRHGAFSVPSGRVRVRWSLDAADARSGAQASGRSLRLEWSESGGPLLAGPPGKRGFGTRLLTGALPRQLNGRVSLDFPSSGFQAVFEAALGSPNEPVYAPMTRPRS
jgi:two-component sensor histidine kinase